MAEVTQADRDAAIDLDERHIIQVWSIDATAKAFAEHRARATEAQAAEIERLRLKTQDDRDDLVILIGKTMDALLRHSKESGDIYHQSYSDLYGIYCRIRYLNRDEND